MAKAVFRRDGTVPAGAALARGPSLLAELDPERPVCMYGAALAGASVVLGAYQHAPHALAAAPFEALALPVVRRQTGGAAVWGGEGVLYLALGLLNASALMACPPGKILNRNVRGFLAGLRSLGAPAHYFGRDFVSLGTEPCAYVGWDEAADGKVLLEFFVGFECAFTPADELSGYPERREPALRGKRAVTLKQALAGAVSADELLRGIALGYARTFKLELEEPGLNEATRARAPERARVTLDGGDDGLSWSDPLEEAIGFVAAGVRLDADHKLTALRLAGDFFQARSCEHAVAERMLGAELSDAQAAAAIDAVYGARPGLIEGLRSLRSLQQVVGAAHARAIAKAGARG